MPVPPTQWQGSEDSMRNWLATKAEEERRRQEEERTRQETLRLDQRRVEHSMLRESLQGGVPPHMVPMIFAGIGGANMANVSLDWLQQYTLQLQQQQQAAGVSPELRRESRLINPPTATYAAPAQAPQQGIPGAPIAIQPPPPITQHQSTFSAYPQSPGSRARAAAPTSAPRASAHAALPRLTTNEMQIHQPPTAPSSAHPLHQTQTIQPEQPASSPSIYFHHWVPPTSQAEPKSHKPPTPSGRDDHVHEGDYKESPRKRKAQGAHQAAPVPSQHTSPSFSTTSNTPRSKNAHGRTRSNTSKEGDSSRQTSSRRDSAALGSQGEVDRRDRESTSFKQAAPPSPPREVR
ncbi:hypothetical protein H2203_003923 [Taxawa tesnikishii (nom. ined.)]|nr:hypothetical protein H2203_003923 [Dothideales sp. JES 119]